MNHHARCQRGWYLIPPARGQMLILVLWIMGLVSAAVGALVMRATHEVRLGQVPLDAIRREAIAEAGVWQALGLLARDDSAVDHLAEPWATGEEAGVLVVGDVPVGLGRYSIAREQDGERVFGLLDEERKLNLNAASREALERLFTLVGLEGSLPPDELAAAVLDWIDGPEDDPFCEALPYPCHNGPMQTVDELRLVPGMTPELMEAVRPHVTVYGHGAVNVNTASALVLEALGCPGEALAAERETPFLSPPPECPNSTVRSHAFRVPLEARLGQTRARARLFAVVDRGGTWLAWSRE